MYSSSGSTLFRWPVVPPTVIRVGSLRSKASSLATAVDYWSRQPGAAYSAGLRTEAGQLLVRLEEVAEPTDLDLAVLRAHAACADRKVEAVQLGQLAPGIDPETAFGFPVLIGHHANWAAHGYSPAVWELRQGQSASGSIAEADQLVRHTRSGTICCVRSLRQLSTKPAWWPQPRPGSERLTPSAARPVNVPCNVGFATPWRRSAPKSRRVQHQPSRRTWPDSGSPLARQRFCGLSTPGSATLTSPIACSSRPGPSSPMSAACCKKPDEPAGSSCRQPTALKTEPHNGQRSSRSAGRGVPPRLGRPEPGRSVDNRE
jgi:hypothetical protein